MADQLRAAFAESGMTRFELSKRSGVPYSSVHRFLGEGRDIAISTASKLCGVLELRLTRVKGG